MTTDIEQSDIYQWIPMDLKHHIQRRTQRYWDYSDTYQALWQGYGLSYTDDDFCPWVSYAEVQELRINTGVLGYIGDEWPGIIDTKGYYVPSYFYSQVDHPLDPNHQQIDYAFAKTLALIQAVLCTIEWSQQVQRFTGFGHYGRKPQED